MVVPRPWTQGAPVEPPTGATEDPGSGRAARPGDSDHASPSPPQVVLYGAEGCHLCERARATVVEAQQELGFELEEVAIDGDEELETRYRELIPVLEIDGKQEFVYFVDPAALRRKLAQTRGSEGTL
jgi:glutaredoxin